MKGKKEKKEKGSVERIEWRGGRGVRKGQDNFPLNSFYKLEKKKDIYLNEVTALTWHSRRFRCHLLRVKRSRGGWLSPRGCWEITAARDTHMYAGALSQTQSHTAAETRLASFLFSAPREIPDGPIAPNPTSYSGRCHIAALYLFLRSEFNYITI